MSLVWLQISIVVFAVALFEQIIAAQLECKENEMIRFATCQATCNQPIVSPENCEVEPHMACFCRNGYVRNNTGECILFDKCPSYEPPTRAERLVLFCKGENEEVRFESCENTCGNPQCTSDRRRRRRCVCKRGLVRQLGVRCIPLSQCVPCFEPNTEFRICETYCFIPLNHCPYGKSKPACYCKEGYARVHGECLPNTTCYKCPGENEEYRQSEWKDHVCSNLELATPSADTNPACYCKRGFARSDTNVCIQIGSDLCQQIIHIDNDGINIT